MKNRRAVAPKSVRATGPLVAALVATSLIAAPGQAGTGGTWTPEQELWSVSGGSSPTPIAAAVSGNGKESIVFAKGKVADWTGTRWSRGKVVHPDLSQGYIAEPRAQLSRTGRTALLAWDGDSDEGIANLYRALRSGGGWKAGRFGSGYATSHLAGNGRAAITGWYEVFPDDGTVSHVYAQLWAKGAGWSAKQDLALPGPEPEDGYIAPQVAISDDGSSAVIAWYQAGRLQVSFWDGAGWQAAPFAGAAGARPLAVDFSSGGVARILTAREVADGVQVEQSTATPAGGVVAAGGLGTVAVPGYTLDVSIGTDGSGLVSYPAAAGRSEVAAWQPGQPWTVTDLGGVVSSVALAKSGGVALATTMGSTVGGTPKRVAVRLWDGEVWGAAKRVGSCRDKLTASALSASGRVRTAAWTCGHIHATRSPRLPTAVRNLQGMLRGRQATIRWQAAKYADHYQWRTRGFGARWDNQWQATDFRHEDLGRLRPGQVVSVDVRAANPGGVGPISSITLR